MELPFARDAGAHHTSRAGYQAEGRRGRSDRLFCERLDCDILFRRFLDMNLDEPSWDHSTFSANRDRLLQHDVARQFFEAGVAQARRAGLLSDEDFTVDGTLLRPGPRSRV